jgi:Putative phage serine protease XkdF
MTPEKPIETFCRISKKDEAEQIVTGMVYAPDILDAQGDMMEAATIKEMAYSFIKKSDLSSSIDKEHSQWPANCYPVESYIAREGDPDFVPGAWVLSVKINDDSIWTQVMKGEINGFSVFGSAFRRKAVVEYDYLPTIIGITDPAEDGHTHSYMVKTDENGKPTWGQTSTAADGHTHEIKRGTATNEAGGHKHRINLKVV